MADNDWKSRLNVVYSTNPDFEYETEAPENIPTLPARSSRNCAYGSTENRGPANR